MRSTKSCRTWREHVFIGSATLRRAGCTASGLKPASSSGSQADCACSRRRIGPGCGAYIVGVCVLGQNLARSAPDTLYSVGEPSPLNARESALSQAVAITAVSAARFFGPRTRLRGSVPPLQMSRNSLRAKKGKRIVLIGLDGAGKTTILQQLINRGAAPDTLPTIGFTVQVLRAVNPGFTRGG